MGINDKVRFAAGLFGIPNAIVIAETAISGRIPVAGFNQPLEPDEPDFISSLGTPVYGSVKLGSTDPNKDPQNQYIGIDGKTYTFDTVTLPIAIITANLKNNIIKTRIQGRPGTIKEYIAMDDYDIVINGIFDNPHGISPKTDVALLHRALKAPISIPVTSYYLNQLGIYYITVEEVTLPQEPGKYSSQAFTIHACSDNLENELLP